MLFSVGCKCRLFRAPLPSIFPHILLKGEGGGGGGPLLGSYVMKRNVRYPSLWPLFIGYEAKIKICD